MTSLSEESLSSLIVRGIKTGLSWVATSLDLLLDLSNFNGVDDRNFDTHETLFRKGILLAPSILTFLEVVLLTDCLFPKESFLDQEITFMLLFYSCMNDVIWRTEIHMQLFNIYTKPILIPIGQLSSIQLSDWSMAEVT